MAWEISHTEEAWACFRRGLEAQDRGFLQEACATCEADDKEEKARELPVVDEEFDWQEAYKDALWDLNTASKEELVQKAYDWCKQNNTCSNGGWDFYIDKGGYYSIEIGAYEEEEA